MHRSRAIPSRAHDLPAGHFRPPVGRLEVAIERRHRVSKRPSGLGGSSPEFARGMSLAFEFVGAVFLFWLAGRFVDDRLGTEPWLQVVGALIGWVGGFLHVYYRTKGVDWQGVPGTRRPAGTATGTTAGAPAGVGAVATGPKQNETEAPSTAGTGVRAPAPGVRDEPADD